ncbi:MAG: F0F1 ATP synthase subunit A [Bacteroidetes bacterium]|nr:F0F1 ATP synthase subunit A [Bacteroidota bacterium]
MGNEAPATAHGEDAKAHTEAAGHKAADAHAAGGKFSPGKMIMDHVADAHDWHLFGHVSIPLPVILYTKSTGLKVFMSSAFHHGEHPHEGFRLTEKNKVVWEDASNTEAIYDFSITKNVFAMFIAVGAILLIMISIGRASQRRAGKAPRGLQNLLEPLILFIRDDIARPNIGVKADKFLPMLLTIFWFIFINNLFGLIPIFPGGANVTGNIAVTMVLSLVVFITVTINANSYYWKHIFLPDVPKAMYLILVPIEILGVFLRPFVLMLRLFANITAGHIIILGFFSLIFIFGAMKPGLGFAVSPLSVGFTLFMSLLELLVAFLQAFVFTLLTAIYIGMAVEEHSHAEHH